MTDPLEQLPVPAPIIEGLKEFRTALIEAAGTNLVGLVLYGGLARGRFLAGRSDVNVVVVLQDTTAAQLERIAPVLRAAFRQMRVEPLLLAEREVAEAAELFPTKMLDIQAHHRVLHGRDVFSGLSVSREHVRFRLEQDLRNHALRLRKRFVAIADDRSALRQLVAQTAMPLTVELSGLLQLTGHEHADTPADIASAAQEALSLDGEAVIRAIAIHDKTPTHDDVRPLFARLLEVVERACDLTASLKERR